jgi:hypothetical protein
MKPLLTRVVSAHVMGGCGLAGTERRVSPGPTACTGSWRTCRSTTARCFPTSIGANPQLSIYGIVNRLAQGLAKKLSGRDVTLA